MKPPFFTRRVVQVTGAFVLGLLAMVFVVWVTNGLRQQSREERTREREAAELQRTRAVVETWKGVVDAEVANLGGQVTDPTTPPVLLPAASAAIDGLAQGGGVTGGEGALSEASTQLRRTIDTLDSYALVDQIRDQGFDITQTSYLLNSKTKIVEGLRVYMQAVVLAREAPIDSAQAGEIAANLRERAESLFAGGWSDLQQVQQSVGINPAPAAGS